jgi:hypothetical protein
VKYMTDAESDRTFRAYFSHSYRWQQKGLNHFVWKTLSPNFFFTVDPPDVDRQPMLVPHLETMMLRSHCFIAVIARRDDLGPQLCSPYQLFENALAIRTRRPRLLIVSQDIDSALLGPASEGLVPFEESDRTDPLVWFRRPHNAKILREAVEEFVTLVRGRARGSLRPAVSFREPEAQSSGPIGLALPPGDDYLNRSQFENFLRNDLAKQAKWLDLAESSGEGELLGGAEACSLIVQEVRETPSTPLDIQGLLHANFRPTVRVCRLREGERKDDFASAMHLSRDRSTWSRRLDLPVLYAGYQVGPEMEPILFWQKPEELFSALRSTLQRIRDRRMDLETDQAATRYFLSLGRVPGKVFISNHESLNDLVYTLRPELDEQGVEHYHYNDPGAKRGGEPGFPDALRRRIAESAVFLALISTSYGESLWCMEELRAALERANEGRLIVLPFLLEKDAAIPALISYLDAPHLYEFTGDPSPYARAVQAIVAETLKNLESNQRLRLAPDEEELVTRLRACAPENWRDRLIASMKRADVPDIDINAVVGPSNGDDRAGPWNRLIDLARRSYRAANALGVLLISLAAEQREADTDGRRLHKEIVALAQRHRLVPDVRSMLEPSRIRHEVGVTCVSTQKVAAIFEGLKGRDLVARVDTSTIIEPTLFSSLVRVAGTFDDWIKIVQDVGKSLEKIEVLAEADNRVDELTAATGLPARSEIGLCIFGDERGLQVPLEWHCRSAASSPICLEQPVRRFLTGVDNKRPTLRTLLLSGQARPLRALLVGSDAGNIPRAEMEAARVQQRLLERFEQLKWPHGPESIKTLIGPIERATLQAEISLGDFDVLHIAAHGDIEDGEAGLRLRGPEASYVLSSQELGSWVSRSQLLFAYLSCCRGAEPETGAQHLSIRRFDNLIQAFVKESVPEVLGFVWPIRDDESLAFAELFYNYFRQDFRASSALLNARRNFKNNERIWAAPVLYSQADTQYT